MDFASLMSAQISKSKSKSPANTTTDAPKSKYLRRADLEADRQAKYAAEQSRIESEREDRLAKKRKLEEDEAEANRAREEKRLKLAEERRIRREAEEAETERLRRKRLGLPELLPDNGSRNSTPLPEDVKDIEDSELQSKLRNLNEPAILYDESHSARLTRYHHLTGQTLTKPNPQKSNTPIPTILPLLPESDMAVPETPPSPLTPTALHHLSAQLTSYLTLLLSEWSTSLSLRPAAVKSSPTGVAATQTYTSVIKDLTPLYRLFETSTLPPSLLTPITAIIHACQSRRYVTANDLYLQLAIGKSAWPIGVTMVGIHERSAREKLHESGKGGDKEAHIMADEVTRKILQSLKRCLSFAQTRWPPADLGQLMG